MAKGETTIHRMPARDRWVSIRCATLEDDRLTWKARGLLAYLLTRPDDWQIRVEHLITQSPEGVTALRSAIKELTAAGYMKRVILRDAAGQVNGTRYEVHEVPEEPAAPSGGKPASRSDDDPPSDRKPDARETPSSGKPAPLPSNEEGRPSNEGSPKGSEPSVPTVHRTEDDQQVGQPDDDAPTPAKLKKPFAHDSSAYTAARFLYGKMFRRGVVHVLAVEEVEQRKPGAREAELQAWADEFRKMNELDRLTWDTIRLILDYLLDVDDWWIAKGNFQTARKLREKKDGVRRWQTWLQAALDHRAKPAKSSGNGAAATVDIDAMTDAFASAR